MRIFSLIFAIAAASSLCADEAFASKPCSQENDHITIMGVRLGLAAKPNPVLIEINLDSPPASFSDPPAGFYSNLAGHHEIVGVALDRNFSNPMLSDARYNNFEDAVARWLGGTDAPEAFCGFNRFTRQMSNSFSIYASILVAKDGFGNEIRMLYDRNTGEMTIRDISDSNGRPFPSRYEKNVFTASFSKDHSAALAYAGLLENAGVRVSYIGAAKISSAAKWRVSCNPEAAGVRMACQVRSD